MPTGNHDPNYELVTNALGGDESAAAKLYHCHADRVYRIAYRVILDEGLAKDASQETWIKVFRNLNRYRLGSSFQAWVSSIAARTAIDMLRKRNRIPVMESVEECGDRSASNYPSVWNESADREIEAAVIEVVKRLPDTQRAAFILRHFEGMPLREIGESLGCAEGTVKAHIHRAVMVIRDELKKFQLQMNQDQLNQDLENKKS